MKTWSEKLIKLSREYLQYSGTRVKSINGDFGILNIDYDKNIYTIIISNSDQTLTFNTVDDIINSGWVVD
jgi:hypothetical protein